MSDHQKVHPVDVEASTSEPPPPSDSSRSEKDEPEEEITTLPPREPQPEPETEAEAESDDHHPRRGRCYRCCCWTFIIFLILIVLLGITTLILYLVFRPKAPKCTFNSLVITDFSVEPNSTVYARFDLTVTNRNPNKRIGIHFRRGSNITVWYSNIILCTGTLPKFYQGHRNTTVLDVILTGRNRIDPTQLEVMEKQLRMGRVPLDLKANVPVRLQVGAMELWRMRFKVRCNLTVHSLNAQNVISLISAGCKFKEKIF